VFHTYADHRMAHAGLIIGAAVAGVQVENVATTSKTFPGFAQVWESMFEG
jgi:3-phosphoshikimate 1-carboxyvinyltransferase